MRAAEVIDGARKVQGAYRILATYLQLTAHLFMPPQPVQDKLSVDYIVVGAGSSGAVIANRLTEDGKTTVLVLEAGGNPPTESMLPGLVPYLTDSPYGWNFIPEKERNTFFKDDVPRILQGKMLGGTTSINYLNYIRGSPKSYEPWAESVNDDSWSYENLLKYFKKSEDLKNWNDYRPENRKFHGRVRGYIDITKENNNATHLYLKAFQELGNKVVEDINGATPHGITQPMNIIDNGYRQSTATYLSNKIVRENLILYRYTTVVKILFDGNKRAVGVVAVNNKKNFTFYAKKEVIVAAGVFNTPKLLMLSQIGPKEELIKMKIGCISDLPVGKNLQYHTSAATVIKMGTRRYEERLNPRAFPTPVVLGAVALDNSSRNFGSLGYLLDSKLFLTFCAFSLGYKNKYCDKFNKDAQESEIFFSVVSLLSPKSRGSVSLRSVDYTDPPVIDLGMFSHPKDLDSLAEFIEYYMGVANTSTFRSVGAETLYLDLPDTNAERGSRDYWKSYASHMGLPFQSYAGTCSMGKVVDTELCVFGVQNLRVADASIIPIITTGSMDTPTIMIGEKAADLIKGKSSAQTSYESNSDKHSSSEKTEESSEQESSSSIKNEDDGTKVDNYPKDNRNKEKKNGEKYVSGENDGQIPSVTVTRAEITQYIQEIVSELQVRINVVITELDKNGTTVGVTYIKENINLSVKQVEQSKEIFLSGINENGSYNTTYVDSFVQNVVKIFKEKQVVIIKEVDGNTSDYTDADKVVIKANISYCYESIVQFIGQKRDEIIQRMTQKQKGNNVSGK